MEIDVNVPEHARAAVLVVQSEACENPKLSLGETGAVAAGILRSAARLWVVAHAAKDLPVEVAALCCRQSFELMLHTVALVTGQRSAKSFREEAAFDETEILQGMKRLNPQDWLDDRLEKAWSAIRDNDLNRPRELPSPAKIARKLKWRKEYECLYPLFSRYTHAGPWLIMQNGDVDGYQAALLSYAATFLNETTDLITVYVDKKRKVKKQACVT